MKHLVLSVLAALALVTGALAQDTTQQMVTGTVVSTTSNSITIDTSMGRQTFQFDSSLDHSRYDDLKPGQRVQIMQKLDATGVNHMATDITVLDKNTDVNRSTTDNTYGSSTTSPGTYSQYNQSTTTTPSDQYSSTRTRNRRSSLPATASPLGGEALLGLMALLAGFGLRKARSHS